MHALPLNDLIPECVQQGERQSSRRTSVSQIFCKHIVSFVVKSAHATCHQRAHFPITIYNLLLGWRTSVWMLIPTAISVCQWKMTNFPFSTIYVVSPYKNWSRTLSFHKGQSQYFDTNLYRNVFTPQQALHVGVLNIFRANARWRHSPCNMCEFKNIHNLWWCARLSDQIIAKSNNNVQIVCHTWVCCVCFCGARHKWIFRQYICGEFTSKIEKKTAHVCLVFGWVVCYVCRFVVQRKLTRHV